MRPSAWLYARWMPTSDAGEIVGQELIVRIFSGVLVILAGGAQISDVGLAHIGGLTELKWLNLRGTPVSSAGWGAFADAQEPAISDFGNSQRRRPRNAPRSKAA